LTLAALPKEYHKDPFADIDRSFVLIVLLSFLFHFGVVGYFVVNPPPVRVSPGTIKNIQDQFATLVIERETDAITIANTLASDEPVVAEEEMEKARQRSENLRRAQAGEGVAAGTDSEAGSGTGTGTGPAGDGSAASVEEAVSGQGILGVLTASSGSMSSAAVRDVLGEGGTVSQDYDRIYSTIDRLTSDGRPIRGTGSGTGGTGGEGGGSRTAVQGERATQGGTIDGLISGPGKAPSSTSGLSRKTEFITAELAPMTESGDEIESGAVRAGARDPDEVATIVLAHSPAIEYCYQRELTRNPDLKGKIAIRFTITPEGKVVNPLILSSTLKNERVERCILSRVSRWDDFGAIDPSLGNATFRQVYSFGY